MCNRTVAGHFRLRICCFVWRSLAHLHYQQTTLWPWNICNWYFLTYKCWTSFVQYSKDSFHTEKGLKVAQMAFDNKVNIEQHICTWEKVNLFQSGFLVGHMSIKVVACLDEAGSFFLSSRNRQPTTRVDMQRALVHSGKDQWGRTEKIEASTFILFNSSFV